MAQKVNSDDITKVFFDIKICEKSWGTPKPIRWGRRKAAGQEELTHDDLHCKDHGRMLLHLYKKHVPKTVENFTEMCRRNENGFKGSKYHRIISNFMMQGGQIPSHSIFGPNFKDENFVYKHSRPGLLSMANRGPNTNSTQFFVTV